MYEIFKFKSATDTTCMNLKSGNQSKVYAFKFFFVSSGYVFAGPTDGVRSLTAQ